MSSALTSQRASDGMLSAAGAPDVASRAEYVLPAWRGIGAQTAAALGLLTGLWVAFSPYFITLQHHGTNAATSDLIAGLAVAAIGAVALASPRGFPGLEFGNLLLGSWLIIAPFVLAEKFSIATSMYWSNIWAGSVLMALALAGLATLRRPAR
jgi:SPW repeat-containing protein